MTKRMKMYMRQRAVAIEALVEINRRPDDALLVVSRALDQMNEIKEEHEAAERRDVYVHRYTIPLLLLLVVALPVVMGATVRLVPGLAGHELLLAFAIETVLVTLIFLWTMGKIVMVREAHYDTTTTEPTT